MKALVRDGLPKFTDDEKTLIKRSFDFIGINYYTSKYATTVAFDKDATFSAYSDYQFATISGISNPSFLVVAFVTAENKDEKRDDTIAVETTLQDDVQIQHILAHLYAISVAMKQGANVNGYFMWALMDCMEIGSGYTMRYGLAYTNYLNNLDRILKKSAKWLKVFLAS
ncbi:myrosinase 4-like [Quercus robur]|uniref:myrosinase 4-like n=1 Tax=Quercus robur TaxID=38942 RepID=UPI0021619F5F|nr:myrosinase 4-like [Quercus robur]